MDSGTRGTGVRKEEGSGEGVHGDSGTVLHCIARVLLKNPLAIRDLYTCIRADKTVYWSNGFDRMRVKAWHVQARGYYASVIVACPLLLSCTFMHVFVVIVSQLRSRCNRIGLLRLVSSAITTHGMSTLFVDRASRCMLHRH